MRTPLAIATLFAAAALTPLASLADGDHDRARAGLRAGEVLPLHVVLERVAKDHPGNVLEVELEREKGLWIYELKILQGGGLLKLKVDARTAAIIRQREVQR